MNGNARLKDSFTGQKCFIIGNGPSLNEQNLTCLKDQQTIVVNFFCLHQKYKTIRPKHYLLLDPVVFTRPLLYRHFYPQVEKAGLSETRFYFPLSTKALIDRRKLFTNNSIHYLLGESAPDSKPENFDMSAFSQFIDSSGHFVLLMAAYMGFATIYLLGQDLNFLDGESHFYPDFRSKEKDPYLLSLIHI